VILLKRGEAEEARKHLAKAAASAPDRTDIQVNYGEALVTAGQHDAARTVLDGLASKDVSEEVRQRIEALLAQIQ